MKSFFTKLQERLFSEEAKQCFHNANVKPIAEIDFYKQQYLSQELFETLILPAVLVDFDIVYPNHKKPAEATISLHCCYEIIRDTSGRKQVTGNNALTFFDFVDIIFSLVKDLESPNTGKLELTSENQEKNDSIIYTHILTFKCTYTGKLTKLKDKYTFTEENKLSLNTDSHLVQRYNFDN